MSLSNIPWGREESQDTRPGRTNSHRDNAFNESSCSRKNICQDMDGSADGSDYPPSCAPAQPTGLTEEQSGMLMRFLENTDKLDKIIPDYEEKNRQLEQLIHSQIDVKDSLINKLHAELDEYKNESSGRFEDQLIKAVIKVRMSMIRTISSGGWSEKSADEVRKEFEDVLYDLTSLLELQNVDSYHTVPGTPFDKSIHQKTGSMEPTEDKSLDKTVKKSLADGYRKGDRVLVAERVILQQYVPQMAEY